MKGECTRRQWLAGTSAVIGAELATRADAEQRPASEPFGYCFNTSTIMEQKLDLVEIVEIAARAGYRALEPWIRELERYVQNGGILKDLGQRLRDHGLNVESAIGFPEWIVDDKDRRAKGLKDAQRAMELVQQIGGKRLAAPPAGVPTQGKLDLLAVAERYRALLELGDKMGVVPQIEFWGHSPVVNRLGQAALIAIESGHPQACILADVYHLYKGGSNLGGLRLLGGNAMHVLHFNDYPALPPRASITDAQRVFPGDGVAPLKSLLRDLRAIGFRGVLSLELFNRDYWKQDPMTVAHTGLEKMRAAVQKALS